MGGGVGGPSSSSLSPGGSGSSGKGGFAAAAAAAGFANGYYVVDRMIDVAELRLGEGRQVVVRISRTGGAR